MKKNYHHLITIFIYAAIAALSLHVYSFDEIPRGREFTRSIFKPFLFFCILPLLALCLLRSAGVLSKTVRDREVDDYWASYYRGKHRMSEDRVVMALSDGEKELVKAKNELRYYCLAIDFFRFFFTAIVSVAIGMALFGIAVVYWLDMGPGNEILARVGEGFEYCQKPIAGAANQPCFSLFLMVILSACTASVFAGVLFYFRFIAFPSIRFFDRKLNEIRIIKGVLAAGDQVDEIVKKGGDVMGPLRVIKIGLGIFWFEQHGRLGLVVIALHVLAATTAVAVTVSLFLG